MILKNYSLLTRQFLGILIISALLIITSSVFAWSGPSDDPPTCNTGDPGCDAPVNVGLLDQNKLGGLGIDKDLDVGEMISAKDLFAYGLIRLATIAGSRVGIGTNSPNPLYKLDVLGDANATRLCIAGDCKGSWPAGGGVGPGTVNYLSKFTGTGATLGDSQIFDNGTNVGIGTASPTNKLQVAGNTAISGTLSVGGLLSANSLTIFGGGSIGQNPGSRLGVGNTTPGGRHTIAPEYVILDVFSEDRGENMIITGVKTPTEDNDAATKAYVDAQVSGGGPSYLGPSGATNGGLAGITGANFMCDISHPNRSAHICTMEELIKTGLKTNPPSGWVQDFLVQGGSGYYCAYSNYADSGAATNSNCAQWTTSASTEKGCAFTTVTGIAKERVVTCNTSMPILCCGS